MPITYEEYIKLTKEQLEELYLYATEEDKKVYFDYAIKAAELKKNKENKEDKPENKKSDNQELAKSKAKELNLKYKLSKDGIVELCSQFLKTVTSNETIERSGNVRFNQDKFLEDYKSVYVNQLNRYLNALTNNNWDRKIKTFNEMINDFEEMANLSIKRKKDINVPKFGGMDKQELEDFIYQRVSYVKSTDNSFFTQNYPSSKRQNKREMKALKQADIEKIVDNLQKNFRDSLYAIKNIENHKVKLNTVMAAISKGYQTLYALYNAQSWWYQFRHPQIKKLEKDTLKSIKETCKTLLLYNGNKMNDIDFTDAVYSSYSKMNYIELEGGEKYENLLENTYANEAKKDNNLKENLNIDELKMENNIKNNELDDKVINKKEINKNI